MNFRSVEELKAFISNLSFIGDGSQKACYYCKQNNMVYAFYHFILEDDGEEDFFEITKDEILRFSDVSNKTFIWPKDVITVGSMVVGYVMPYVKATNLYKINPLNVSLDKLAKNVLLARDDIKTISLKGINTYDMMYNTLYGSTFKVVDEDDYSFSRIDPDRLIKINNHKFDMEIYYFLVDGFFEEILSDNKLLSLLYKDKDCDVLDFLKLFRAYLSEQAGKEIVYLREAKDFINKSKCKISYERGLYIGNI